MQPGATVFLVSAIIFTFCIMASGMVLLISKRRRRGKERMVLSDRVEDDEVEYSRLMTTSFHDDFRDE